MITCSNFQPSDMVDTICVSSSSEHCRTLYTFFMYVWENDEKAIIINCIIALFSSLGQYKKMKVPEKKKDQETNKINNKQLQN